MSTLFEKVVRLAYENPEFRKDLLPILREAGMDRVAGLEKVAISQKTRDLIKWILLSYERGERKPITDSGIRAILKRMNVEIKPYVPTTKKGPLEVGEYVIPDKHKNRSEQNMDLCERYHGKLGLVTEVTNTGVVVRFDPAGIREEVEFFGHDSGRTTGLYRSGSPESARAHTRRPLVEGYYYRDPSARPRIDKLRMEQIDEYLSKKEDGRNPNYFSGYIIKAAENKQGKVYIRLMVQQGRPYLTINPSKGTLLYFGWIHKRPNFYPDLERWLGEAPVV